MRCPATDVIKKSRPFQYLPQRPILRVVAGHARVRDVGVFHSREKGSYGFGPKPIDMAQLDEHVVLP